eukprot:2276811-Prymnesium_polylepis.1
MSGRRRAAGGLSPPADADSRPFAAWLATTSQPVRRTMAHAYGHHCSLLSAVAPRIRTGAAETVGSRGSGRRLATKHLAAFESSTREHEREHDGRAQ